MDKSPYRGAMPNRKFFISSSLILIFVFLAAFWTNQQQIQNFEVANIEEKSESVWIAIMLVVLTNIITIADSNFVVFDLGFKI